MLVCKVMGFIMTFPSMQTVYFESIHPFSLPHT
jgi:hypothetical protein